MTRVVSITSIPLQRDSRTFKFAASVARLGHESVVLECQPSTLLRPDLPFDLISPRAQGATPAAAEGAAPSEAPPAEPSRVPVLGAISDRLPVAVADTARSAVGATIRSGSLVRLYARDARRRNRIASDLLPAADVYWLHGFWQLAAVYSRARRERARFLYDTPDAYWEPGQTPAADRTSRALIRAWERSERFGARRAEAFTTVSDGLADLMEARFGRRPQVVRNLHDLRLDEPSAGDVRSAAGLGGDDYLLVVVGNLKPELTAGEALEAMRMLPESVHIAFVGVGHEANREFAVNLGLGGRAHFLGHQPPTELVSFIRTADAAPVLSRATTNNDVYSLPNKFFHAIAAGLPVLYPGLPEMANLGRSHDLGVEIDPESPESIARGVKTLLEAPDRVARYRANAEKARQELNWEREEGVLRGILSGAGGEGR